MKHSCIGFPLSKILVFNIVFYANCKSYKILYKNIVLTIARSDDVQLDGRRCFQALGVGRARVNQLIRSGMLAAEKVGGIWLIDEQSVEARRNAAPKAGRPPASSQQRGCGALRADESHARRCFRFATMSGRCVRRNAGDIVDPARAPLGMISPPRSKSLERRAVVLVEASLHPRN